MRYRKLNTFAILLCFVSNMIHAQTLDDSKYLMSITYLRTNAAVNEKIKDNFPEQTHKKDKFVEFNLFDKVSFLGITGFWKSLKEKKYLSDEKYLSNADLYSDTFYFEPFESSFLKRLSWEGRGKLFLSFSKPIENYLVAELTEIDPKLFVIHKYGKAMQFFFKFDSLGVIEDVLYSGSVYN